MKSGLGGRNGDDEKESNLEYTLKATPIRLVSWLDVRVGRWKNDILVTKKLIMQEKRGCLQEENRRNKHLVLRMSIRVDS